MHGDAYKENGEWGAFLPEWAREITCPKPFDEVIAVSSLFL